MGCCYSHEDEYDPEPRPVYAIRRPTPAATSSHSNYDYYNQYRAVSPPRVRSVPIVRNQISTPNLRAVVIKPTQEFRVAPTPSVRSVPIRNKISTPNVRAVVTKPTPEFKPRPGALYGEYKCSSCKYFWVSRLSWRDKYQQCKRCKANVRPRNQRELLPSDFTRGENDEGLEHPQDLWAFFF